MFLTVNLSRKNCVRLDLLANQLIQRNFSVTAMRARIIGFALREAAFSSEKPYRSRPKSMLDTLTLAVTHEEAAQFKMLSLYTHKDSLIDYVLDNMNVEGLYKFMDEFAQNFEHIVQHESLEAQIKNASSTFYLYGENTVKDVYGALNKDVREFTTNMVNVALCEIDVTKTTSVELPELTEHHFETLTALHLQTSLSFDTCMNVAAYLKRAFEI